MKESYIQLYNRNEKAIKAFMILSIVLTIIGITNVVLSFLNYRTNLFALSEWHNWFLVLQGIAIFFILKNALKSNKYFISWNIDMINFYFPKCKQPESIIVNEINSIKIDENIIEVSLKENEIKTINLNYVFIPKRAYIKEYFKLLKNSRMNHK